MRTICHAARRRRIQILFILALAGIAPALGMAAALSVGEGEPFAPQAESGVAGAASIYALDGWEVSDAPLLHRWLTLAPLTGADIDSLIAPEAIEGFFPEAGRACRGRLFMRVNLPGEAVLVSAAGGAAAWALAHCYLNVLSDMDARFNLSVHGADEAILRVNGREIARATAPALRVAAAPASLRAGWNRIQLELRGAAPATFYVQVEDGAGQPLPCYAEPQLNDPQRAVFAKGGGVEGAVLARLIDQAIADLHAPFTRFGKALVAYEAEVTERGAAGASSRDRLRALRRLAGLIAMGADPREFAARFDEARRSLPAPEESRGEEAAHRRRAREGAAEIARALEGGAEAKEAEDAEDARGVVWHYLAGARDYAELRRRYGISRRLLVDLETEAREVVQSRGASSKIRPPSR